jgi:hypothetical protein
MSLRYFANDFEVFPVALIITGITVVFTFHMRSIPFAKSLYYYYYYCCCCADCHEAFLPGASSLEPSDPYRIDLNFIIIFVIIIIIIIVVIILIIIIVIIVVTSDKIRSRILGIEYSYC